ncbi:Hsp20 family protein [Spongorhabdus nitratireducens]
MKHIAPDEDMIMRGLDFDMTPLYRSAIGFDRVQRLLENISTSGNQNGYPPYNIELMDENNYRITMAVAGFSAEELDIESHQNTLTVTGNKQADPDTKERQFLYQGIAERGFERRFQLADFIKVTGASMDNGLLHIELEREIPEEMKPFKIQIEGSKELIAS